jgi:hypothetical protein
VILLNPRVGVAPGTATMQISGGGGNLGCACYATASGGVAGLGVCPPGYYGQDIMLPGMPLPASPAPASPSTTVAVNPYADIPNLKGLGATTIRWDLLAFTIGLGFAGTLGYLLYSSRKKRRAQ